MKRRLLIQTCASLAATALLPLVAQVAHAAPYPEKPVKIIVSLPPGSGADTTARFLAQ